MAYAALSLRIQLALIVSSMSASGGWVAHADAAALNQKWHCSNDKKTGSPFDVTLAADGEGLSHGSNVFRFGTDGGFKCSKYLPEERVAFELLVLTNDELASRSCSDSSFRNGRESYWELDVQSTAANLKTPAGIEYTLTEYYYDKDETCCLPLTKEEQEKDMPPQCDKGLCPPKPQKRSSRFINMTDSFSFSINGRKFACLHSDFPPGPGIKPGKAKPPSVTADQRYLNKDVRSSSSGKNASAAAVKPVRKQSGGASRPE